MKNSKIEKFPIPATQTPWSQLKSFRRKKYFAIATFLILIASFLLTKNFLHYQQQTELQKVYLANQELKAPLLLNSDSFTEKYISNDLFPPTAIQEIQEITDKTLLQNLSQNEIIVQADLTSEIEPNSITTKIPEGQQIITISETWLTGPLPNLGKNDLIDLLAVQSKSRTNQVEFIATNIKILNSKKVSEKQILNLLVTDEEAKNITLARGLNLPLSIIINAH